MPGCGPAHGNAVVQSAPTETANTTMLSILWAGLGLNGAELIMLVARYMGACGPFSHFLADYPRNNPMTDARHLILQPPRHLGFRNPRSTLEVAGHPIHPMLIVFPVAFLVATLVVDCIYWGTGDDGRAPVWLVGAGTVGGAIAVVTGLTDFLGEQRIRHLMAAWQQILENALMILISVSTGIGLFWARTTSFPGASFVRPWCACCSSLAGKARRWPIATTLEFRSCL